VAPPHISKENAWCMSSLVRSATFNISTVLTLVARRDCMASRIVVSVRRTFLVRVNLIRLIDKLVNIS